ncbi:hypothetical protein ALC62_02624 [Cyphomyrmex costatus]|uniref:Uncharacterized protein n=1 Tax=Cyphomyrmex costatus TaxID=456900 RepID=A0A195D0W0_9HYME|nr:hypothetical protein ALC62_02624 [Cyphomyrmex costatus]
MQARSNGPRRWCQAQSRNDSRLEMTRAQRLAKDIKSLAFRSRR